MPKFSYPKKQLLRLLSKDEIERIHFSSMKILEENGVIIKNDSALNLLKESGCEVNVEKKLVYMPRHLVKASLFDNSCEASCIYIKTFSYGFPFLVVFSLDNV